MFVPLRKAVELTGLHPNTLRKYADQNKIKAVRTPCGNRLFDTDSLPGQQAQRSATVCYCRVSSTKQKSGLARQVVELRTQFPQADIIQDVGSELNFKRKGLRSLLDRLLQGDRITLIVARRDRLCRFGFELLEYLVTKNGGEIMVLDQPETSPQSELVQDLLSIILEFSRRVPGLHRYYDDIKKDTTVTNSTTETAT